VYHKAKASGVIEWILGGETLDERQRRIQHFLENEGYFLPEPPKGVDRSEEGDTHIVRGWRMTVEYAVIDQSGRKVYLYREIMIDHIMLQRIARGEEWALEHVSLIPRILKSGQAISEESDKIVYHSRRRYRFPDDGEQCFLRVIIKRGQRDQWYVATFHPRYPTR
jgi:hypothetical protein